MKRENYSRQIVVLICIIIGLSAHAYSFMSEGIYYNILADNETVEVTYRDTNYDTYIGAVNIPSEVSYNGVTYKVTTIGDRAFYKCSSVTEIYVPETISKIGTASFKDANHIQKVNITDLSSWCMINVTDDSTPLLYGGLLYLNGRPVDSLESLNSSCTKIGRCAFYGNTYLLDVIIPESVTIVEPHSFEGCSNMRYLEVGSNVMELGSAALIGCSSLKTIKFLDSENSIKLGAYRANYIHPYFKDCPLEMVYIGRDIHWAYENSINSSNHYPFTKVKTAIFNQNSNNGTNVFSAFENGNLTTAYVGPKCNELRIYSGKMEKLYICNNTITNIRYENTSSELYVIDKTNIPDCLSSLNFKSINNLIDLKNLKNDETYVYGDMPSIDENNFGNNVEQMNLEFQPTLFDSNVGLHNEGLSVKLKNDLWSTDIKIPFSYNILPAPLTIMANNASKKYGTENPEFTCSYFGFKNNETKDVLIQLPSIETTATVNSDAGPYPIIPFGAESKNYTITYEKGTLTITKAEQMIKWEQQLDNVNVGDVIELTATSSSGLPIKYTSTDESIADIYSQNGVKYVEFLKSGNVILRATQAGNENYNEADMARKAVTVNIPVSSILISHKKLSMKVGEQVKITAYVNPSNATNTVLRWYSEDDNIASVKDGVITAVNKGYTTIVVESTDGTNIKEQCTVKVGESGGVEEVSSDKIKVKIFNKTINISNVPINENVSIYQPNGILVKKEFATRGTITYKATNRGIYIIVIGKFKSKVLIN